MKIEFLANKLKIGEILGSLLRSRAYGDFRFAVAYVRSSGVKLLEKEMRDFIARGGIAQGVIGINQGNTSHQGLSMLADIFPGGLYLRCGRRPFSIFHPKLYMLGEDKNEFLPSAAVVGSSNFTAGGFVSNEECGAFLDMEQGDESVQKAMTEFWGEVVVSDGRFSTVRAYPGILSELLEAGALVDENTPREKRPKVSERKINKVLAAASKPLYHGFAMTLSQFDVSPRSLDPVILIPIKAREQDEKFWFWPHFFVSARKHRDLYIEAAVTVDGVETTEKVRIYEYRRRSEFRLQSSRIKRSGKQGDILLAKRSHDSINFSLVRKNSPEHARYINMLNHRVSTQKVYGYF